MLGYYARGHYGQIFDNPWVLASFTAMFLLPFLLLRTRSLVRPPRHRDAARIRRVVRVFDTTHSSRACGVYPVSST